MLFGQIILWAVVAVVLIVWAISRKPGNPLANWQPPVKDGLHQQDSLKHNKQSVG
jgi:hypothetical protein